MCMIKGPQVSIVASGFTTAAWARHTSSARVGPISCEYVKFHAFRYVTSRGMFESQQKRHTVRV